MIETKAQREKRQKAEKAPRDKRAAKYAKDMATVANPPLTLLPGGAALNGLMKLIDENPTETLPVTVTASEAIIQSRANACPHCGSSKIETLPNASNILYFRCEECHLSFPTKNTIEVKVCPHCGKEIE